MAFWLCLKEKVQEARLRAHAGPSRGVSPNEEDDEPFAEKRVRLVAERHRHQTEVTQLDAAIWKIRRRWEYEA